LQIFVTNLDSPVRCLTSTTFRLSIDPFGTEPLLAHTIIGTNPRALAPGSSTMFEVDFPAIAAAKDFYATATNVTRVRYTQRTLAKLAAGYTYQLTLVSGDNQSSPVLAWFATPMRVRATNASGAPVAGLRVVFRGPAALFVYEASCDTDANGECGVRPLARSEPGSYVIRAFAVFNGPFVDVRATNTAATPPAPDTSPSNLSFAGLSGVGLAIPLISSSVIISGTNTDAPVSVTNGEYSMGCNGMFTTAPGTIRENQAVCVRQISAATPDTFKITRLTVGSTAGEFVTKTAILPSDIAGVKLCSLDADGDGRVDAMTDGLLIMRYMKNPLDISNLTANIAIPANALRKTGAQIADFLAKSNIEIVANNRLDSTVDGMLLLRSLLGFTNSGVTDGISIPSDATRKDWLEFRQHLRTNCGLASKIR
jgi:hypothetical protein